MHSPSIVRIATPADHDDLWRLFLMGHRENGLFPLKHEKVEWFLQRALYPRLIHPGDTGTRAQLAVIGPVGKLEGMAFVILNQYWYSEAYFLDELIVYVDPECRKSDHAKAFIEWLKKTSDDLGIPLLTGIISKDRTAAKIRLYDRYLPRIGAFYLHPLKGYDVKKKNHKMSREAWLASRD